MTALIKAVIYSLTGYMMAWCWDFGHTKAWRAIAFIWCLLMATDLTRVALPVRKDK